MTKHTLLPPSRHTRRAFLKAGLLGALGTFIPDQLGFAAAPTLHPQHLPYLENLHDVGHLVQGTGLHTPGKVIEVTHSSVYPRPFQPMQKQAIPQMIDAMIYGLTGKNDRRSAWGSMVIPGDRVGIVVDTDTPKRARFKSAIVGSIVQGLLSAGVPHNNIIIWTAQGRNLSLLGYSLNWTSKGIRVVGADQLGYDSRFSYKGSQLSTIVSRHTSHTINITTLTDHPIIGCRLSMAQQALYSFSNAGFFLKHWGGPHIGQVAVKPILRKKFHLHIIDGIVGTYNGQVGFWHPQTILASTDPVALDRVGLGLIETQRQKDGLPMLSASRSNPKYMNIAALYRVGVAHLPSIKRKKIHLK